MFGEDETTSTEDYAYQGDPKYFYNDHSRLSTHLDNDSEEDEKDYEQDRGSFPRLNPDDIYSLTYAGPGKFSLFDILYFKIFYI